MSKWKIKQEVDLVLLFEMFLIGKCKAEQANWYIFNKYRNWPEINQSNCTIHGRKFIWFLHSVIDIRNIKNFGEYSDLENDILTTQRFLDVSRFLYSEGWQVWVSHHVGVPDVGTPAEALPGPAMSYVGFINASRRCQKLNENSFLDQNFRKGG